MPQPVCILRSSQGPGSPPKLLRRTFGWKFEVPSPVRKRLSESESYGFLDTITAETEPAFPVVLEGGRPMRATHCFTSA